MSELISTGSIILQPDSYELGFTAMEAQRVRHGIKRWTPSKSLLDKRTAFTDEDWHTYASLNRAYKAGANQTEVRIPLATAPHICEGLATIAFANLGASVKDLETFTAPKKLQWQQYLAAVRTKAEGQIRLLGRLNDCITEANATGKSVFLTENENERTVTADTYKGYSSAA